MIIYVSSAVSSRDSTWRCAELIACLRAFQCHNDRLGLLIVECASDGEDRSAVSAGGSGVLMAALCVG